MAISELTGWMHNLTPWWYGLRRRREWCRQKGREEVWMEHGSLTSADL